MDMIRVNFIKEVAPSNNNKPHPLQYKSFTDFPPIAEDLWLHLSSTEDISYLFPQFHPAAWQVLMMEIECDTLKDCNIGCFLNLIMIINFLFFSSLVPAILVLIFSLIRPIYRSITVHHTFMLQ